MAHLIILSGYKLTCRKVEKKMKGRNYPDMDRYGQEMPMIAISCSSTLGLLFCVLGDL